MTEDFNAMHIMALFLLVWCSGWTVLHKRRDMTHFGRTYNIPYFMYLWGYFASGLAVVLIVGEIANWLFF